VRTGGHTGERGIVSADRRPVSRPSTDRHIATALGVKVQPFFDEEQPRRRAGKGDQSARSTSQGDSGKPEDRGRLCRQWAAHRAPDTGGGCDHVPRHRRGIE
jgi:hypothetical protein